MPTTAVSRSVSPAGARQVLLIIGLALAALIVRLPNLELVPRFEDEGIDVLWALEIANGQRVPLTGFDAYYGPLFSYLVAGVFVVLGPDPLWPRLLGAIFSALTVPAAFVLGTVVGCRRAGLIAAALTLAHPTLVLVGHYGWSNTLTPFFATVAVIALYVGVSGQRMGLLVLGGILCGLTVQTHPISIVMAPGLIAWSLFLRSSGQSFTARHVAAALGGLLVGYAPMWWTFLTAWHAVATRIQEQTYAYAPIASVPTYLERLPQLVQDVLFASLGAAWLAGAVIGGLAILGGSRGAVSLFGRQQRWALVVAGCSLLSLPLITNFFLARYVSLLLPLAFVWVAALLMRAWDHAATGNGGRFLSRVLPKPTQAATLALAVMLSGTDIAYLVVTQHRFIREGATNRAFLDLRDRMTSNGRACPGRVFVEDTDAMAVEGGFRSWVFFNFHSVVHVVTLSGCTVTTAPRTQLLGELTLQDAPTWLIIPEQSVPIFAERFELTRIMAITPAPAVPAALELALFQVQPR